MSPRGAVANNMAAGVDELRAFIIKLLEEEAAITRVDLREYLRAAGFIVNQRSVRTALDGLMSMGIVVRTEVPRVGSTRFAYQLKE